MTDPLANSNVLVTGANGFLGRHVVDRLLGICNEVHTIHHHPPSRDTGTDQYVGDLTNAKFVDSSVSAAEPTYVYHLAAETAASDGSNIVATNVAGTRNVLAAAADAAVDGIVFTSTANRYAESDEIKDESASVSSRNLYGSSKLAAESLCKSYAQRENLSTAVAVPFLIYGPGQPTDSALIPSAIEAALKDRPFETRCSRHVRDPVFVDDTVEALATAPTVLSEQDWVLFNVCRGRPHRVRNIVETIYEVVGADAEPVFEHYPRCEHEMSSLVGDPSYASNCLGWKPSTSWRNGIRRTVQAYK